MKVPIAKPLIGEEEKRAVLDVLESGMLTQGEKVKEFEERFSRYIGTKHAIATSNGTTALHAAVLSLGIGKGDEVITTPFTFIATSNSVLYAGAKPVFADINPRTFNIDPETIEEKITPKTKAVLIVHLYGQPCDMKAILDICEDYNLRLVGDACQAHGAVYKRQKVGSFGDMGVFSFYPTKNMTTGEGGMITTNNKKIAEKVKSFREHGQDKRYYHTILGYNYRMTDISAAIGMKQLKKLDKMNERRIRNAKLLTNGIEEIDGLISPYVMPEVSHVFNQYTLRIKEGFSSRDKLKEELKRKDVGTKVYYPVPIHKQPLYSKLGYKDELPEAEKAAGEVLSLPVHPNVSENEINYIISCLEEIGSKVNI